jgi:hypothetical protein
VTRILCYRLGVDGRYEYFVSYTVTTPHAVGNVNVFLDSPITSMEQVWDVQRELEQRQNYVAGTLFVTNFILLTDHQAGQPVALAG